MFAGLLHSTQSFIGSDSAAEGSIMVSITYFGNQSKNKQPQHGGKVEKG